MLVRDCMKRDPLAVTPDDTLARALALTREHRVRHLPVALRSGDVIGILSDRDIRLAMPSPLTTPDAERADFLERTAVAAVMTREVITIGPDDTIEDAASSLYRHRIGSLPVIDSDLRLVGMLTDTDILYAFVRILGVAEGSSRIELALEDRPGELGRALTIIAEQARLNIVSVVLPSLPEEAEKRAVLHVATIDPREAIEALEHSGFKVGWPALARDTRGEPKSGR